MTEPSSIIAALATFLAGWLLAGLAVGIILGRFIANADRHGDSEQRERGPVADRAGQGVTVVHTQSSGSIRSRNNV